MRTTIIPAQITTVEDKIAGSLNFVQILLFMVPVLWGTVVYTLFLPFMKVTPYKITLVLIATALCLVLALRVKDKIVAQWIAILLKYHLRAKRYLFNKNDLTERAVDLPVLAPAAHVAKALSTHHAKTHHDVSIKELIRLEEVMHSKHLAVSFRFGGKG